MDIPKKQDQGPELYREIKENKWDFLRWLSFTYSETEADNFLHKHLVF